MNSTLNNAAQLLLIDDDMLVRGLAAEALMAAGFRVAEAADGQSGLALALRSMPDVVLLDLLMPGMDGFAVCRQIRATPALARVPVIVLTGLDDSASIEDAYDAGATDFITKPINAALLAHRVRYTLRASRMLSEIDRHRASLANAQRMARIGNWSWLPETSRLEYSEQYQAIVGHAPATSGFVLHDLLKPVHPDDREALEQAIARLLASGDPYSQTYRICHPDGKEHTVQEDAQAVRGDDGRLLRVEGTTQDVSERVAAEVRIRQLADYDSLTGLANRRLFAEVVRNGLARARRNGTYAAVLDINLDRFKRINETLGHAVGDQVLREAGRRLVNSIRASDVAGATLGGWESSVLARMNGDDFAVFLPDVRYPEDAALIARRVAKVMAEPLRVEGHDLAMTCSIGIAIYPENGTEVGTLLKNAETAMHTAKPELNGAFCFFTPTMNTQALAKLEIEADLRSAIERGQLMLYFQPRVDVHRGCMIGAETLLRWQHPVRGLVPPSEFIPIAEECGLIRPITEWVVRSACRQVRLWLDEGLPVVPLSVNFSADSFRDDGFTDLVRSALSDAAIAPSLIEGEITESMMMHNMEQAIGMLQRLRDLGVDMSMDDFGTGYSSLSYLKRLPVNVLKIDRSFVKDLLVDAHDAAIASAIITLAKSLGLAVVAEGMEQVEQANFLLDRGCSLMQGFLFSRPLPASEFRTLLATGLVMPAGLRIPTQRDAPALALVPANRSSVQSAVAQA